MLVFEIFGTSPRVGVDHDGGRGVFGRHGATQDQPVGEWVGVAGRVSWQWKGFVGMPLVHPNGSARPWVPWCG